MQAKPKTNPMAIIGPLKLGEKVALAAASLAIQHLPLALQQASNAHDMRRRPVVRRAREVHPWAGAAHLQFFFRISARRD
jgi:hypothetical protein